MFELPEVEVIRRDITNIEYRKIAFNNMLNSSIFYYEEFHDLSGLTIESVERYGLYLIIKIGENALLIKPRKTGKFILENGTEMIPELCHWIIQLNNSIQLRYVDTNSYPNIRALSYESCVEYINTMYGPEPFDIKEESFILNARQYPNDTIRKVLMNDKVIFGVGAIYSLESCYEAFIHPLTLIKNLTDKQLINIIMCARRVLNNAIKNGGIFKLNYTGNKGKDKINNTFLKVFRQYKCNRCNINITNMKGNTYFCEGCQRLLEG
jgi:formamidopyrimidine-DNA glycosylase